MFKTPNFSDLGQMKFFSYTGIVFSQWEQSVVLITFFSFFGLWTKNHSIHTVLIYIKVLY